MKSIVILYASSRPDGNTAVIADYLAQMLSAPSIDLSARPMAPFSYENDYPPSDTFLATFKEIMHYDQWVLITPVYWYTMSAQMKIFFDRFSDILRYHETLRPRLSGKDMWAICCSSTAEPIPDFFTPFRLSAEYLGMTYQGDLHTWGGRKQELKPAVRDRIDSFLQQSGLGSHSDQ